MPSETRPLPAPCATILNMWVHPQAPPGMGCVPQAKRDEDLVPDESVTVCVRKAMAFWEAIPCEPKLGHGDV